MAKLEDLLKSQGFTDADLATVLGPLDARMRTAIEASYGIIETEASAAKREAEEWAKWHEEHGKPTLQLYEKDMTDAKAEAASLRERLRLAEENGFAPKRTESTATTPPTQQTTSSEAWDAKKHNVPTWDDLKSVANAEGEAIAMASDLAAEYHQLTGKSLLDYTYRTQDGRELRGMRGLRAEAQANKQPDLYRFAENKFNFQGERNRISEEQRKKAEDAIRADERSKVAAQYGNPNTRPMEPSRQPFIPRAESGDGKMPWEKPAQERNAARLQRLLETQAKSVLQ